MSRHVAFERFLADRFAEADRARSPVHSIDDVLTQARRMRPLPRWLATIKEPPMRISARTAVGSPIVRLASLMILVLMLSILTAGGIAIGATLLASPVPSGPATLVVAQDDTGDFTTISEAVAAARAGDTVSVRPGTYRESVTITSDITLIGDGPAGAVVIAIPADGPTTRGIEGGGPVPFGIALVGSDAHLTNLAVTGPVEGVGISVSGGAPVLESVSVVLAGEPSRAPYAYAFGDGTTATLRDATGTWFLGIADGSSPTIERLVQDGGGFVSGTGSHPLITESRFGFAIDIGGGAEPTIEGSHLMGVKILTGAPVIRGNTFANPSFVAGATDDRSSEEVTAIEIVGGAPLIEGNRIGDHEVGILVPVGSTPTIRDNRIESNTTGIVVVGPKTAPIITGNTFCDNGTDLTVPEGSSVTLDGNTVCAAEPSGAPSSDAP